MHFVGCSSSVKAAYNPENRHSNIKRKDYTLMSQVFRVKERKNVYGLVRELSDILGNAFYERVRDS